MTRRLCSIFAFLSLFAGGYASATAPSVLIRAEVSPKEIYIGDPIHYHITVSYSSGVAAAPFISSGTVGEFELLDLKTSKPEIDSSGKWTLTHDLYFTTFSTGTQSIPELPLQFRLQDGSLSEARTEQVAIKVKSLLEEKGDEGNIRALKGLVDFRSYTWIWVLLLIAALIGFGYAVWRFTNKRGEGDGFLTSLEPPKPPEEIAWKALLELEDADLIAQGQSKEFYYRLSMILRNYMEGRYQMSALDKTTAELTQELRQLNLRYEISTLLREFFDNADLVKFAKFTPEENEIVADLNRVKQFVNETTPKKEAPQEKIPV